MRDVPATWQAAADGIHPDLRALSRPFPAEDIEWRIQSVRIKNGKPLAIVLAYVTARAVMTRFDDVCGPDRWSDSYAPAPDGGVLCTISVLTAHGWVSKQDGAENTDIEKVKGGLSGAFKRAAVKWGIGRYLYELDTGFANIHQRGKHYQGKGKVKSGNEYKEYDSFHWDPPALPAWALPAAETRQAPKPAPVPPPPVEASAPPPSQAKAEGYAALEAAMRKATTRPKLDEVGARAKHSHEAGVITESERAKLARVYGECRMQIAEAEAAERSEG